MKLKYNLSCILCLLMSSVFSQVESGQTGAWYMYFFSHQFKESQFGIQGDIQYRNWNLGGDLEQLLLRAGATYSPKSANLILTLGYANITTGEFGDGNDTTTESRIYQEALIPQKVGNRIYLTHRFRYEQRFVEDQDFRTRYRYNLFFNLPFNKQNMDEGAIYLALYNELFVNGQKDIGKGRTVAFFDRNRTYLGLGYTLKAGQRIQLGWMNQKSDALGKAQLQLSFHHKF
ncbi:DUF2490 domain-containing protein [Psychroserpens sp. XS_ASV72]|uniref:DUF2490 domain-containing protein n=1 Tax=Psychroserpens sp. XS_ASV72 TaxID=3241293 RepID=UPI003519B0E7